uniref:AIG1-type G domain-containing protein n=1 Tax=Amphimedon queenslandica TaxID=400682 RepID=A0A1X7VR17_AMPQE
MDGNSNLDASEVGEVQTVNSPNVNLPIEEPQATIEEPQAILQEKHKEKFGRSDVHILFTGLSGAGKSTLVNAMLGEVLARTGCGPDSIEAPKSYYEGEFEGVKLQVCDTNGYSESNHKIPKSDGFNLILLCIKITYRVGDSEVNLLQALGEAFDKEAWNRTVIVLTFANFLIEDPKIKLLKMEEAKCQAINNIMEEYKESITKHLERYMDKEMAYNIPFCLAGISDPFNPKERSVRELPTTEDWLVDLWETCANRVSPEKKNWFDQLFDFIKRLIFKILRREEQQQQHDEEQQVEKVQEVELEEKS